MRFIGLLNRAETNVHKKKEISNVQPPSPNQEMSLFVEIAEVIIAHLAQSGRSADEQQVFRRSGRERQPQMILQTQP